MNPLLERITPEALCQERTDALLQHQQLLAQRNALLAACKAIVEALSQPVQTCEPSERTATILLGDCTFARQTAKEVIEFAESAGGK